MLLHFSHRTNHQENVIFVMKKSLMIPGLVLFLLLLMIGTSIIQEKVWLNEGTAPTSIASVSLKRSFDLALKETTKLLYHDSSPSVRDFWLSQPAPTLYIYDTLSPAWSNGLEISRCVDDRFGITNNPKNVTKWDSNCQWDPQPVPKGCPRPDTLKRQKFMGYWRNYNSDVSYLKRFQETYPYTTTDPNHADLLLVPYPHKSHCLCHQNFMSHSAACAVPKSNITQHVIDKLTHLQNTTLRQRHLFLLGADYGMGTMERIELLKAGTPFSPMTLSLGAVPPVQPTSQINPNLAVPYTNRFSKFQPFQISDAVVAPDVIDNNRYWEDRPFAMGAAFGVKAQLRERTSFLQNHTRFIGSEMGGKPHSIHRLKNRDSESIDFNALYRNSTFCLILMGDGCAQKRFFDVILNGCIPVAAIFHHGPEPSLLRPYCIISQTYPFSKQQQHSFSGQEGGGSTNSTAATTTTTVDDDDTSFGLDMLSIVVTYDGECGMACMKEPMERLMSNKTALRLHQLRLQKYAMLSSFGLGEESYKYPDAFMATVVSLRHRLWYQMGKV